MQFQYPSALCHLGCPLPLENSSSWLNIQRGHSFSFFRRRKALFKAVSCLPAANGLGGLAFLLFGFLSLPLTYPSSVSSKVPSCELYHLRTRLNRLEDLGTMPVFREGSQISSAMGNNSQNCYLRSGQTRPYFVGSRTFRTNF